MLAECEGCQATVDGQVEAVWADTDPQIPFNITYTCLRCPRCSSPIVMGTSDEGGVEETYRMYPSVERLDRTIPRPIRTAYEEAVSCIRVQAFTASAIMCRKTLEAICAAHGVRDRNLLASLEKLKEQGTIESRLYEWADALRIAGNEAAHDVDVQVSPVDARDLLEFTSALLEYTFTFRERFEKFKARRAQRNGPRPAP